MPKSIIEFEFVQGWNRGRAGVWQEILKDLEYYISGLRPFNGLSELERNSRIFKAKEKHTQP